MFEYIKGELISTEQGLAVVECNGIGYKFTVSGTTMASLAQQGTGAQVCLFTYLCVREDALELIGFSTKDELHAFKLLILVSGVGPKGAVAILSQFSVRDLTSAIVSGDAKRLAKAQGIGPKTAARIVLELKDKMATGMGMDVEEESDEFIPSSGASAGNRAEAVAALRGLGYTTKEAEDALRGVDCSQPLANIMTAVLRKLGAGM